MSLPRRCLWFGHHWDDRPYRENGRGFLLCVRCGTRRWLAPGEVLWLG